MAIRKANPKAKAAPAAKRDRKAAPAPEPAGNRFVRVAKVLIDEGENVDIAEIALRTGLDHRTAKRCRGVVLSVINVLRDAKLMPANAAPKKALAIKCNSSNLT